MNKEHFYIDGFEPADTVRAKADAVLTKVRDASPREAKVTGNLEFDGEHYHSSIEIGSLAVPLAVSMQARFPLLALDRAEFAILRKLDQWRRAQAATANASIAS